MKIQFLGDVHSAFGDLVDKLNPTADMYIQVGDMAHLWTPEEVLPDMPKPLHFIAGNHDNYPALRAATEWPKNVHYQERNTRMTVNGTTIHFFGGAESIDKRRRTPGISWWEEEIPTYAEFQAFADMEPCDIIVTHTSPFEVTEPISAFKSTDPVAHSLQAIVDGWNWMPKYWFFGHFHQPMDTVYKGCQFYCLPCVHDHEYPEKVQVPNSYSSYVKYHHIAGSSGITLDI